MTKLIGALLGIVLSAGSACATCSDSYYNSTASSRVNADVALLQAGDFVVIGDSHFERMATTYAQRSQSINGHPVVILGSAGATWQTIRDCFPWSAIGARSPGSIYLQSSVNDAVSGQCCDANGNGTVAYAFTIMQAAVNAYGALGNAKWPAIGTDPPPESAAGISASVLHNATRMVYYVATNSSSCGGGSCKWSDFGWTGTTPTGSLQFIDQYYLMRAGACDASSVAYSGNGCLAATGATLDNVHFPHDGVVTIFGNLAGLQ